MEISDAISTEEMRRKLQNLREYMPNEPEFTYDYIQRIPNTLVFG